MKQYVIVICTLLASILLTVSCSGGGDDGVVIVPSDRTEVTAQETTVGPASAEISETEVDQSFTTETEALPTESVPSDDADTLDSARKIIEDQAFRQYLEQNGISADDEDTLGVIAAVLAYQKAQNNGVAEATEETVYWTASGSVWHVTRECSALAKSKSVQAGAEADAIAAGKTRACKRCGG